MHHRVANSLQIIASVLMINARRAGVAETRGHLRDAHVRVMSVADVQRHLELGVAWSRSASTSSTCATSRPP